MYLITLRFDSDMPSADDADGRPSARRTAGDVDLSDLALSRLYAAEGEGPKYLAWHETPIAGLAQRLSTASDEPESLEKMSFQLMRDVGDTAVSDAPWLYIVHTDIPDHIVDEYNAWYDEEHLPRLVTVPGVLRARRYMALAGNPRYLTAYELAERDAFTSPEGLKARKTPWTEKMRSLFFNTRRLMGRLIVPDAEREELLRAANRLLVGAAER